MLFKEHKVKGGKLVFANADIPAAEIEWEYQTKDIFGTVTIVASRRLQPKELDNIVFNILKTDADNGDIKDSKGNAFGRFRFQKNAEWLPCDHVCTSKCRRTGCNCECGEFHKTKDK